MRIFFIILLLLLPLFAATQDILTKDKLEKIADDMKYKNAYHFVVLKKNKKAIQELHEYLEIYTSGIHRHEAFLALANIHFSQFEYYKAIHMYKRLYEEFSSQDEGVHAFYYIGICYKKMGYNLKAVQVFKDIIKNHPSSHYAYKAKLQLDVIGILN